MIVAHCKPSEVMMDVTIAVAYAGVFSLLLAIPLVSTCVHEIFGLGHRTRKIDSYLTACRCFHTVVPDVVSH